MIRLCVLVVVLAGTSAAGAPPRVLATTGVKIGDRGIASIERPQLGSGGDVLFRGTTTRIALGGLSFASGDPLPAPFQGTIEAIVQGAQAGNVAAIAMSANGPDIAGAIFLVENGTVTPLVTAGPMEAVELGRFVMNGHGDLAYVAKSAGSWELYARPRAGGGAERIAGPDRDLRKLDALVIDASGATAWRTRRGVVSHWDATHGTRVVGSGRRPPRRRGASSVALHDTFGLAYATKDTAVLWSPASGVGAELVRRHAAVNGSIVIRIYGNVGFLEDGSVAVEVRTRRSRYRYLCFSTLVAAPCDGPGVASAGDVVDPVRSTALFLHEERTGETVVIVAPGDAVPDAGTIADVTDHAVDGQDVVLLATLTDATLVLARRPRNGMLRALAIDGQAVGATTLDMTGPLFDYADSVAAVGASTDVASLALIYRQGRVRPVQGPRADRFDGVTLGDRKSVV